ncbi:MAG: hypothetical protein ABL888_05405 [Pirellulaceae bacterium]
MIWKSIWAVVSGLIYTIAMTTLIDVLMTFVGVFAKVGAPIDNWLAALALSYRVVVGISGAYLAAWLAPFNPARHVFVLASIGTVLGLIGMIATWDSGLAPNWFSAAIAISAYPQSLLGLVLHDRLHRLQQLKSAETPPSPKMHTRKKPSRAERSTSRKPK